MKIETISNAVPDLQGELLDKLRELIPSAFPDGVLDQAALLKSLDLGADSKPSFSFAWPGLERARLDARTATTATLIPDPKASLNWDKARDILIEGDNLQVLKLLKAGYSEAAKLIYIDPPYNTGDTFTYNDKFAIPETEYLRATGQIDDQGNPMTSRIEKGGKKHAPWLTMMFSRLTVSRHLLRRDGVLLLSIDDNEVHHIRILLDAVFGANNFVGAFVWNGGRKNDARRISVGHDYILAYAKDLAYLKDNDIRWRERKQGLGEIYAKEQELRVKFGTDYMAASKGLQEWYKSLSSDTPAKAHEHYRNIDSRGIYFASDLRSPNPRPTLVYTFRGYTPHANGWAYSQDKMEKLAEDDRLVYPQKEDGRIQLKSYLHEHEEWAPTSVFYKDRRAASKALKSLMGAEVFDYPKDVEILGRFIHSITSKDDLIVDFFAGSGSTGHAVWTQDQVDDVKRRWLLVQAPEEPNASDEFGANAIAQGYKTIFEITAERLRRSAAAIGKTDLGFRVFRTRPTNLIIEKVIVATDDMDGNKYIQTSLDNFQASPVAKGADALAIAWEVVLKSTNMQLDAQVSEQDVNGVTVYEFRAAGGVSQEGRLLVCLDSFDLDTANTLELSDNDTLILRGDKVSDNTTLTLAPRLQSKLILLERIPREVSL